MANFIGWVVIVLLVLFGFGFVMSLFEDHSDCMGTAASGFAMAFVKGHAERTLSVPHAANFDWIDTRRVGTNNWRVRYLIKTKNIFGGPVAIHVDGVMECIPLKDKRKWRMVSFSMQ